MKKLFALALIPLAGCSAFDPSTLPETFTNGVVDGVKWLADILFQLFTGWWIGLF